MKLLISDVVNLAEKQLKESGIANAKGEAEMIYCHMKKIDRVKFFQRWSKPAGGKLFFNCREALQKRTSATYHG